MPVAIPIIVAVLIFLCNLAFYLLNENSISKKWWKGGQLLATTNRLPSKKRPSLFWAWDILNPNDAVNGIVPKWALLTYRCAAFTLFCFCIIYQGLVSGFRKPSFSWLIFYTNWTFVGFGLIAFLGVIVLTNDLYHPRPTNNQEWTFLRKMYLLVYTCISSSSIFLTIFYWTVDYDGDEITLDNVIRHGVNVVVIMGDVLLSRLPVVTYHFQGCLMYGTVYLVWLWIYHEASGDWVYDSLNWDNTSSLIYYGIVPLMLAFGFGCMYGLATFRERVIVRKIGLESYDSIDGAEIELGGVTVESDGVRRPTL